MKVYQQLILSVLVHAFIYLLALQLPSTFKKTDAAQEIEIVYQNETTREKTFVQDYDSTELALKDLKRKWIVYRASHAE